jgi:hypothetical protein
MGGTPTRPTYNEENRKLKESAEHWHKLYLARCLTAQDDAARSCGEIEALEVEIEALEVEIEALKSPTDTLQSHTCTWPTCKSEAYQDALATQVHAELIGQKPVAWRYKLVGEERWQHTGNRENLHALCLIEPLYTSPPARAWFGLTDDEIWSVYKQVDSMQYVEFTHAIEAKLREKNT